MSDQIPSNLEAEKAVLSAIIKNPKQLDRIASWIRSPDAFWRNDHKKIWICMLDLNKKGVHIDLATLYNKCMEKFKDAIKPVQLSALQNYESSHENVEEYAKIIWEKHVQREAIAVSKRFGAASKMSPESISSNLLKMQKHINELNDLQPNKKRDFETVAREAIDKIIQGNNIIEYKIPWLDDPAGGMTRGELTALGGRPGHGKTTLMLNVLDSFAQQGLKVVLFNREMTNEECVKKLLVMNSNKLRYDNLRKKVLGEPTIDEIRLVHETIIGKYSNVIMFDGIRDLETSLREIKKIQPDVFMDDYIQLVKVTNGKKRDRRFEIEAIMNEYLWIAKETDSAGFLLSQLSREIEKRIDPTPVMGDYAEGATIEQLAEACLFINYGYSFDPRDNSKYENEIISKKVRYGEIGSYTVGYNGSKCKFYNTVREAMEVNGE